MTGGAPTVLIVEDDASVRRGLERLLRSTGHRVLAFGSAKEFLDRDAGDPESPRCVVLDVRLPGRSGIDLQHELARRGDDPPPIVFITGHGDIPMSVQAMKDGAVDFLPKPFDETELLDAVGRALELDREAREQRREVEDARRKLEDLTPRELEVLRWVITGLLNKQIAGRLGIAEKTVKVHRGRVMQRLGIYSVAELVRLAERAGLPPAE